MDCTVCKAKHCRSLNDCNAGQFSTVEVMEQYWQPDNQEVVQSAAQLVDHGRAGSLSRLQEIIEFAKSMKYRRIGLAYCYGMESEAIGVKTFLQRNELKAFGISCTAGAMGQDQINQQSVIENVSCNPLAQAQQLNAEKPDLVVVMGLCLGHDILFHQHIKLPVTTLVVKDRVNEHNPMKEIKKHMNYERDNN